MVIRLRHRPGSYALNAFLVSTGIVSLAEIGDKTQLLALVLATRFRKPLPIALGILFATLVNHALAGALGAWMTSLIGPVALRWILGLSFVAMAVWTLVPDRLGEAKTKASHAGAFATTLVAFFLMEMGDKTQVATIALAAQYHAFFPVVGGTTLGMMLANVPAVVLGDRLAHRVPTRFVHAVAAATLATLGVATLAGAGARFGF
jgi:putative Ca2+/H+ antiporter (TMEM165/GDT1 family)